MLKFRNILIVMLGIFSLIVFSSCAMNEERKVETEISYGTSDPLLNLYVSPIIGKSYVSLFVFTGYDGFQVTFENTTDEFVKIVWENTTLIYRESSYPPFISGQKYMQSTEPMPPTMVPPKSTIKKTIYSSAQTYYDDGWGIHVIDTWDVKIILCVQLGDREDYYTIHVKPVE